MSMIVVVRGLLRGMGREAECEVVAVKRMVAKMQGLGRPFDEVYSEFGVIEAPSDLPDGNYTVCVCNQTFSTILRHGMWLSCFESVGK